QHYLIKKKLNHPPEVLFEVVSDVSSYQEFVPYCKKSFISKTDSDNLDLPTEAGLRVGFKQFDETFVCKLNCSNDSNKRIVIAESLSHSLFDNLYTKWIILNDPTNNSNKCEINLILEYKFKNNIYNMVSKLFAQSVTQIMLRAFNNRA
ncbi:ubiquinone-binding protein COQ10, partial [Ascoidea rubescens DSM 1968]